MFSLQETNKGSNKIQSKQEEKNKQKSLKLKAIEKNQQNQKAVL